MTQEQIEKMAKEWLIENINTPTCETDAFIAGFNKAKIFLQPDVSPNEALRVALPRPTRDDYLQLANDILEEDITPRRINKLIDEFKEKFYWRR